MTMELFNFPNHTVRYDYPEGTRVQFGNGYVFAAKPTLPLQRTFVLNFEGLIWRINENDEVVSSIDPSRNILALDEFYRRHTMYKRFHYDHRAHGRLVVRFAQPFRVPAARPGGSGLTEPFELQFLEAP